MPSGSVPRRWPLRAAVAGLVLGLALPAAAQDPPDKAGRSEAASARSSLERAQRLAGNPLRAILEAGRMKRRGETIVAEATVAVPAGTAVSGNASAVLSLASFGEPAGGIDHARLPLPSLVELARAQELPPLPEVSQALVPVPVPVPVPAAAPVPQLLRMVEPLFSPDLAPQLARVDKVSALLTLRPDGSVAEAVLQDPLDRQLQRVVMRTLLQWQYDTAPAERLHRVELVFNAGR